MGGLLDLLAIWVISRFFGGKGVGAKPRQIGWTKIWHRHLLIMLLRHPR